MKKFVAFLGAVVASAALVSCGGPSDDEGKIIEEGGTVGFILPGSEGAETKAFKEHWENLAKEYGIKIVYENFQGQDPAYYKTCAEKLVAAGCDAVICNFEMDGKDSVLEYCIDEEIYCGYSGSTISDEVFDEYKDSPYFLGQIAPSPEEEQAAAYEMTKYFIELYYGENKVAIPEGTKDTFAIWPADFHGITLEHQMTYRYKGIKQALEEYGVTINGDSDSDSSKWTCTYTDDSVLKDKVAILGNNLTDMNALITQCSQIFMKMPCAVVTTCTGDMLLSMFAQGPILSTPTRFGTIDAFVDEYAKWYTADTSNETLAFQVTHDPYLVGKYAAINEAILAVTVKAFRGEAIRDNGCAININQSYWHAATKAEFEEACQVSESFSYGKSTFDSITTAAQLQQLFDDATIENLSK